MMCINQKRIAAFIGILRALVPECRLMISAEDGLNVLAVDTANVGMVSCRLPKESFEEFSEEKTEIGMDVERFRTAIDTMAGDTITITRKEDRIIFADGSCTYTHIPLDPSTVRKRPTLPNISLPATIVIDAKEYHETIKTVGKIGDKARYTITGNILEIKSEGDTDEVRKTLHSAGGDGSYKGTAASLFSLDYLKDTAKAMKDAGKITVSLGQDHPVRFDFDYETIEASFILAPRIVDEGAEK